MRGLRDRIALVTGASRGIGRAIALRLAQEGCKVVVNYHHQAGAAHEVVAAIQKAGGMAQAVQADIANMEACKALVAATLEAFGSLDILVNNAGIARDNLLLRMSEADWDAVLATNLKGAFNCIKAAQRTFLRKRYGRIIQIGSIVGLRGNAGQANYAAAKAGLIGLTKALAREFGSRNITVNLVAPGYIETDMTANLPAEIVTQTKAQIPLRRLGQPDDVAAVVAFLASADAAYITGQVLCVDGGLAM